MRTCVSATRRLPLRASSSGLRPGRIPARLSLAISVVFLASACSAPRSPNSPELSYSPGAGSAQQLQVPPDLTDVGEGEQFILPGTAEGKITRNSLLPVVEGARLVREGGERWLQVEAPPEVLWPRLLAFLRDAKYAIEQTEPVAGTIATQWRPASAVRSGGLIRNLIGSDDSLQRVAFRLERSGATGSRLFSRIQTATREQVDAAPAWPAEAGNSEESSALLGRLLGFLGVDEQRRQGLLSSADASNVMSDAVLQSSTSGAQIVLHKGYLPSFNGVSAALGTLGYTLDSVDEDVGRIETRPAGNDDSDPARLVFRVVPVHAGAARVSIAGDEGSSLSSGEQREVLQALRDALA